MTPELRAARDRLAGFADAGFPMPALDLPDRLGHVTVAEAQRLVGQIMHGVHETLAPDLALVLAALDRHEAVESHDRDATRRVQDEFDAGRFVYRGGQCDDCSCCDAAGCRMGLGSTCPTDRLGDSVCPCTGD